MNNNKIPGADPRFVVAQLERNPSNFPESQPAPEGVWMWRAVAFFGALLAVQFV